MAGIEHIKNKTCKICNEKKPVENFHKLKKWYASYCKICQAAFIKEWRLKNLDSIKAKKAERWKQMPAIKKADKHLKRRYGISMQDYLVILESQKGVCKICGQESIRKRLSVDHCHTSGRVRGLLCERCNSILGRVKDNPIIFDNAALYLRTAK